MQDHTILDRLAQARDAEEAMRGLHFHGTGETFDGALRGGGFDSILWCADSPAVAQCYIPSSGLESLLSVNGWKLSERVRPDQHSDWYALVRAMGMESPNVEWDHLGQARSWAIPAGYPTYGEVCDWIERHLGYENDARHPNRERSYRVKTAINEGKMEFLPADYAAPGRLFLIEGIRELRLLDMATGRDGDLQDPDHLKLAAFRRAEAQGWDGVVINDFCQSRTHGNVGHLSWGVLPSALDKIRYVSVPAVRFDWAEDAPSSQRQTPDFEAALEAAQAAQPSLRRR